MNRLLNLKPRRTIWVPRVPPLCANFGSGLGCTITQDEKSLAVECKYSNPALELRIAATEAATWPTIAAACSCYTRFRNSAAKLAPPSRPSPLSLVIRIIRQMIFELRFANPELGWSIFFRQVFTFECHSHICIRQRKCKYSSQTPKSSDVSASLMLMANDLGTLNRQRL